MNNAGTWSVDLSGVSYTEANLKICALDPAGNQVCYPLNYSGDGDCNGDGIVTIADAICAYRIAVYSTTPTSTQMSHADVAPLVSSKPNPDGVFDLNDALAILQKATGVIAW